MFPFIASVLVFVNNILNPLRSLLYGTLPNAKVPSDVTVQTNPRRLFALVIGINEYKSARVRNLNGAVNDAKAIKDYLEKEFPSYHITTLYDKEATRAAIIQQIRALKTNDLIQPGDPIVIFYAGHGTTQKSPEDWEAGGSKIQAIVPHDCRCKTIYNKPILPIPDRTIGALLEKLANKKGDNLTIIFDCCYSGSGTRHLNLTGDTPESDYSVRGVDFEVEIPPELDSDEWGSSSGYRGASVPVDFLRSGLGSHVLLAACSAKEVAGEDATGGVFTIALLKVLSTVSADQLTYTNLIQRILLPTEQDPQNPQCEGHNQGRFLFSLGEPSKDLWRFRVQKRNMQFFLQAGAAHGITPGATFSVYNDWNAAATGSGTGDTIGSLTAEDPDPFSTKMKITPGTLDFTVGKEPFALLTRVGEEGDLRIHIPSDEELRSVFDVVAKKMEDGTIPQQRLLFVEEKAALSVALKNGKVVFNIRDPLVTAHGMTRIPLGVNPSSDDIYPVIRAAAHYDWHLRRTSKERILKDEVNVEFTKVIKSGRFYHSSGSIPLVDGIVDLVADGKTPYGIKVTNNLDMDLYLSAFVFDSSDLSIQYWYQPSASGGKVDPSIPANQSLTIGYGAGGALPKDFFLDDGEEIDVGFVKLFLSTEYIDLSHVAQPSPFASEPPSHEEQPLPNQLVTQNSSR